MQLNIEQSNERPIFVFGASQRTGTTLLQRLINSHPDAFIWGEHGGSLKHLFQFQKDLATWQQSNGLAAAREVEQFGIDSFIANLSPDKSASDAACQTMLRALFSADPAGNAALRWGFKEVRYGADFAKFLLDLFPRARVIFLVRDPIDVARSLAAWEQDPTMAWKAEWTAEALGQWERNVNSFEAYDDERCMTLQFESLIGPAETSVGNICTFLDLAPVGISTDVLGRKIHAPGRSGRIDRAIPGEPLARPHIASILSSTEVRKLRAGLGYGD